MLRKLLGLGHPGHRVGDRAPRSLLERRPGENIGGMVSVDQETGRITAIFVP